MIHLVNIMNLMLLGVIVEIFQNAQIPKHQLSLLKFRFNLSLIVFAKITHLYRYGLNHTTFKNLSQDQEATAIYLN